MCAIIIKLAKCGNFYRIARKLKCSVGMGQNALYKKRAPTEKTGTQINRRILAIKKDLLASSSKILIDVDADISATALDPFVS